MGHRLVLCSLLRSVYYCLCPRYDAEQEQSEPTVSFRTCYEFLGGWRISIVSSCSVNALRFQWLLVLFAGKALVSGRLISGVLLPFLLIYINGLEQIFRRLGLGERAILLAIVVIVIGITLSEVWLSAKVFISPYNWFSLIR
jgi:hypothetical protein